LGVGFAPLPSPFSTIKGEENIMNKTNNKEWLKHTHPKTGTIFFDTYEKGQIPCFYGYFHTKGYPDTAVTTLLGYSKPVDVIEVPKHVLEHFGVVSENICRYPPCDVGIKEGRKFCSMKHYHKNKKAVIK
jgi:hypothetical protein